MAIQFAKLSGYEVITTCSLPQNEALVRSRGADQVFDYRDPAAAEKIRKCARDQLTLVLDTISTDETAAFCGRAMSSTAGGDYTALLNSKVPREDVRSRWTLAYTAGGEDFLFHGIRIPAKPAYRDFAEDWLEKAGILLAKEKIVPHPVQLGEGGLKGVIPGLRTLREHKVRGCKLVFDVEKTP